MTTTTPKDWEKKFDDKFTAYMGMGLDDSVHPDECKKFIRQTLLSSYEELEKEINQVKQSYDNPYSKLHTEQVHAIFELALEIIHKKKGTL